MTATTPSSTRRLALHYGIADVKGDQFRRVQLTQSARHGLLGKGAVLMLTAYPNRTSPVLRGAWILERIMGTPPSPPPPMVESLKENQAGEKPKTVRELMEAHREKPQLLHLPWRHGSAGLRAGELRRRGAVPHPGPRARARPSMPAACCPMARRVRGPDDLRTALLARPDQFVQNVHREADDLWRWAARSNTTTCRRCAPSCAAAGTDNYRFSSIVTRHRDQRCIQQDRRCRRSRSARARPDFTAGAVH